MGGESHGNGTETTRPALSHDATEPERARRAEKAQDNSLSVNGAGIDETVNPCGCKPEQGIVAAQALPGYGAKLNAAPNRRGLTPPTPI